MKWRRRRCSIAPMKRLLAIASCSSILGCGSNCPAPVAAPPTPVAVAPSSSVPSAASQAAPEPAAPQCPPPTSAQQAPPPPDRFALVWKDAWLYTSADSHSAKARLTEGGAKPRKTRVGEVFVVKVLQERDGFVLVENLPFKANPDPHCYDSMPSLYELRLQMFVKRTDLAPVTPREVTSLFDDATGYTLRAGVAVGPDAPVRTVVSSGLRFEAVLGEDQVDVSYVTSVPARTGFKSAGVIDAKEALKVDGRAVREHESMHAADVPGSKERFALLTDCAVLRVAGRAEALNRHITLGRGTRGRGRGLGTSVVHAGAPVFWPDGREAGTVLADISVTAAKATESQGRKCYPYRVRTDDGDKDEGYLPLCFNPADAPSR
jgi:hypothetical protein